MRWIQLLLMSGGISSFFFHGTTWGGVRKEVKPGRWCCGPATRRLLWPQDNRGRFWEEGGSVHIQTQHTNGCHILCQYSKVFFFLSTPTEGSSLFNIMKPQREPAGLCSGIWHHHRWLQGRALDPGNWLWQQREMDKWETPPEWPDGWGRNEETCSVSEFCGKIQFSFGVLRVKGYTCQCSRFGCSVGLLLSQLYCCNCSFLICSHF